MRNLNQLSFLQKWLSFVLAALIVSFILAMPSAAALINYKLSGVLNPSSGRILQFDISPDGQWVVYTVTDGNDHIIGLFSRRTDASNPPIKLSESGSFFRISLDSQWVVYGASGDLYSQPINASTPSRKVSGALQNIDFFEISNDNRYVVFIGQDISFVKEIYSHPLDTSRTPTKLNPPLNPNFDVWSFEISPDGQYVLFYTGYTSGATETPGDIYIRAIDGSGSAVNLNSGLAPNSKVKSALISPDSNYVFFTADQNGDNNYELYRRLLNGSGTPTQLSGSERIISFTISPDGNYIVYIAFQNDATYGLYSLLSNGTGSSTILSGTFQPNGAVTNFQISPNSQWVTYLADQDTDEIFELYSRQINGSGAVSKLNNPGDSVSLQQDYKISPNSQWVVFQTTSNNIYSRPINGSGSATPLNGTLTFPSSPTYYDFQISSNSQWIVFSAPRPGDTVDDLYSRPIDGTGMPIKINPDGTYLFGHNIAGFIVLPNDNRVIFRTSSPGVTVTILYAQAIDASSSAVEVAYPPLSASGDVFDFQVSPDGNWVIYRADQDVDEMPELYNRPTSGASASVKLSASPNRVDSFTVSSNSQWVVYRAYADAAVAYELYSRPINGTGTPARLNGILPTNGDVSENYSISPDSQWVVYFADQETDEVHELYSRPIDGTGSPTKLSGVLPQNSDVCGFQISPDSQWVVYNVCGEYKLYSRRINGSGSSIELGAIVSASSKIHIVQSNNWVVYVDDNQLFRRSIDGSDAPFQLNAPPTADGVLDFDVSPNDQWVVYLNFVNPQQELYSRPLDGSSPPIKLAENNSTFETRFKISSDNRRVIFRFANAYGNEYTIYSRLLDGSAPAVVLGLQTTPRHFDISGSWLVYFENNTFYSRSIDGSGSPTKLLMGIDENGMYGPVLSPDGSQVAFTGEPKNGMHIDLYQCPTDGSIICYVVNPRGSARNFGFSPDSNQIFYIADQDTGGVFELYASMGEPDIKDILAPAIFK